MGKTASLEFLGDDILEKSLILDFEDGSAYMKGYKMHVIGLNPPFAGEDEAVKTKRLADKKYYLSEIIIDLKKAKAETGVFPFKYVTIDTLTKMENYCENYATSLYMFTTLQGKTFNRDRNDNIKPESQWESVISLGIGGYVHLRLAFQFWLNALDEIADHVILIGHTKDKNVNIDSKNVTVDDIDLTGKIRGITASACCAIGTLYRKKNQTILSFGHKDLEAGSRSPHLSGKDFVILESDKDGTNLRGDWSKIYIDEEKALAEINKK